jgi:thiosulfate/3-mercaptopyruvate sulfurtransferase
VTYSTIVSTSLLSTNIKNPDWLLVDCRFDLENPDWGHEDYLRGHIPGAVYAHLEKDLSGTVTPKTGRHPLPNPQKFIGLASAWGIDSSKQVIVYDTSSGSIASRLWWLLRCYGHQGVAVLDGGYKKWQAEDRIVVSGSDSHNPSIFTGLLNNSCFAGADEVDQIRSEPDYLVVDARATNRYLGKIEPIDPVAGHIPGALNRPYSLNLGPDGTFLPRQILASEFNKLLGDRKSDHVVVYCGSGVTSCHNLLAMEYAGLHGARLYPGSWSEWIRDPRHQIGLG